MGGGGILGSYCNLAKQYVFREKITKCLHAQQKDTFTDFWLKPIPHIIRTTIKVFPCLNLLRTPTTPDTSDLRYLSLLLDISDFLINSFASNRNRPLDVSDIISIFSTLSLKTSAASWEVYPSPTCLRHSLDASIFLKCVRLALNELSTIPLIGRSVSAIVYTLGI